MQIHSDTSVYIQIHAHTYISHLDIFAVTVLATHTCTHWHDTNRYIYISSWYHRIQTYTYMCRYTNVFTSIYMYLISICMYLLVSCQYEHAHMIVARDSLMMEWAPLGRCPWAEPPAAATGVGPGDCPHRRAGAGVQLESRAGLKTLAIFCEVSWRVSCQQACPAYSLPSFLLSRLIVNAITRFIFQSSTIQLNCKVGSAGIPQIEGTRSADLSWKHPFTQLNSFHWSYLIVV